MVSEPVKPYFYKAFCGFFTFLSGSVQKSSFLKENGVVKDLYNKYDFESVNDIWIKDILLNNKTLSQY